MAWVVDTCVILDVYLDDPQFGLASADLLENRKNEGLVICPVTFVELSPTFAGSTKDQTYFLTQAAIDVSQSWTSEDTEAAHDAWNVYVESKRLGRSPKRPIADMLIGAFACRFQGLITRNPDDFKPYCRHLKILEPEGRE